MGCVPLSRIVSLVIMWIGGYDDWTPAEQREWDRDLEELEHKEREKKKKPQEKIECKERKEPVRKECDVKSEKKEQKTWMDLALEDPLFKATFTQLADTDAFVTTLREQTPHQLGDRNLAFEVVNPLYQGLNAILKPRLTPQTSQIRPLTSCRQHVGVTYTCYCTPETWSYTVMDEIVEGLSEQLSMRQDLNQGLLIQLSFIKKIV